MYNHKIVAFVLNVKDSCNISSLKTELVKYVQHFNADDKIYLYNSTGESFKKASRTIAELAKYNFEGNVPLHDLMRDAIEALDFEYNFDKELVVINDDDYDIYQISKLIKLAADRHAIETKFIEVANKSEIQEAICVDKIYGLAELLLQKKETI